MAILRTQRTVHNNETRKLSVTMLSRDTHGSVGIGGRPRFDTTA